MYVSFCDMSLCVCMWGASVYVYGMCSVCDISLCMSLHLCGLCMWKGMYVRVWYVYVVYISLCVYYTYMCRSTHLYMFNLRGLPLTHPILFFWDSILTESGASYFGWAGWPMTPRSHLCLPGTGVVEACHHTYLLRGCWG